MQRKIDDIYLGRWYTKRILYIDDLTNFIFRAISKDYILPVFIIASLEKILVLNNIIKKFWRLIIIRLD